MQKKSAIKKYLKKNGGDGHSILYPDPLVKMGFDQEFVDKHTRVFKSDGSCKGSIFDNDWKMVDNMTGVYALDFSYAIAKDCDADLTEAHSKMGRGFQAQSLATAIKKVVG